MTLDERQQHLLDNGLARIHRGRLIPVIRGAEGDGGEGGDGGSGGENSGAGDGGSGSGSPDGGNGGGGDRTFSQADVDRIVQERLARDRKDRPSDDEIQSLRDKATKFDEIDAQNKTELEKAQERAAALERERDEARTAAQEIKLRSAIVSEAAKKGVVDPDAAVALIDRSSLEFGKDGNPTNIADAMDALLTAKPYLAGGGNGRSGNGADQGARGGAKQLRSTEGMSPEEITKALADGRLDEYLKSPTT